LVVKKISFFLKLYNNNYKSLQSATIFFLMSVFNPLLTPHYCALKWGKRQEKRDLPP